MNGESNVQNPEKKRLLIVEDQMVEELRAQLRPYRDEIELEVATDAGQALDALDPFLAVSRPMVAVLDIMMPYGEVGDRIRPDDNDMESGIRVLEYVRAAEQKKGVPPLWVAVITARSGVAVKGRVERLLAGSGRLYKKPFDIHQFVFHVTTKLGVRCQLPLELLDFEDTI
jgi:CheY-like chemotaxis protein